MITICIYCEQYDSHLIVVDHVNVSGENKFAIIFDVSLPKLKDVYYLFRI